MAALALVTAAAAAAATLAGARGDLPAGKPSCGETACEPHTYCSPYDYHCRPCSDLCSPSSNNYASATCEEKCQGYLHDIRYVPRNADIIEHLTRKVNTMTIVASVALIISALLLLLGAVYAARLLRAHRHLLWRFTKRSASHATGKQKVGAASEDPEAGRKAATAALQLPVVSGGQGAETGAGAGAGASPPTPSPAALSRSVSRDVATPATTSTPLSRPRHPSEDTTLEYAYDNPALAPSPSPVSGADHAATLTGPTATLHTTPRTTPGLGGRKESSF